VEWVTKETSSSSDECDCLGSLKAVMGMKLIQEINRNVKRNSQNSGSQTKSCGWARFCSVLVSEHARVTQVLKRPHRGDLKGAAAVSAKGTDMKESSQMLAQNERIHRQRLFMPDSGGWPPEHSQLIVAASEDESRPQAGRCALVKLAGRCWRTRI
jgi:hypothetical protein